MTLIETLLAVMLSSLMVLPVMGWASLALKEQVSTEQRNISSTSLGTLRTFFIRDVTTALWAATEGDRLSECSSGTKGATPLVILGARSTLIVYELVPVDDFSSELVRSECAEAKSAPARTTELVEGVIDAGTTARCDTGDELAAAALATGVQPSKQRGSERTAAQAERRGSCQRVTLQLMSSQLDQFSMTASLRTGEISDVPAAEPPTAVASATPTSGPRRLKVQFDGRRSVDPGEGGLTYRWDLGDGTTSTEPAPVHVYTAIGTVTATLEVTNESGLSATTTIDIEVTNNPPTAVIASPTPATTTFRGEAIAFSSAGSNDDRDREFGGKVVQYLWDFGDGTLSGEADPKKSYGSISPPEGFLVRLAVIDDAGQVAIAETRLIVANRLPSVAIVADVTGGPTPLTVDFSSIVSDESTMPINPPISYVWSFGDGGTSTIADPPPRTYTGAGTRTVTLTVTDDRGATATATRTVTVGAPLLAAPTGLRFVRAGTAVGTRNIDLSWTARSGATLYEVRLTCDGCSDVHTATSTTTSARVNGLRSARTYYFADVRSRNSTGDWGPWSSPTVRVRS